MLINTHLKKGKNYLLFFWIFSIVLFTFSLIKPIRIKTETAGILIVSFFVAVLSLTRLIVLAKGLRMQKNWFIIFQTFLCTTFFLVATYFFFAAFMMGGLFHLIYW